MTNPAHRTDGVEPSFESVLIKLADTDEKLSNAEIAALSLASPEKAALFSRYWPETPPERKALALGRMQELAEDDATLDFSALYRRMLGDPLPVVRAAAIEGLWETDDPSLIRKVLPLMESDPDAGVRAAAAEVLGKFVMLAEYGKLSSETGDLLAEKLLSAFNDPGEEIEVRRRALEAVSYLSRPEVRQAITAAYDSGDPVFRGSALFAAGRNLDPGWLDILLDELSSDLPDHRYAAAVACGEYEDELAVPQLVRLTVDNDVDVKMAAIVALGRIGGPDAKSCLEELVESDDEAVREMAVQSLEDLAAGADVLDFSADTDE
ncbi:HEAT repeat domain-containing protein [Dehalogenimonas sp. THU2]|uniref:HEAT repeat domain-containing protein n=1 Tax=Dehalogenimonas sp. THU2 TaxID=3151121 RepID=UPI003218253B